MSHQISASKEDELKTNARRDYGVTLEFYDANKVGQKITNEYPDILRFLLEDVHKYRPASNADVNIKQRAFYDYLVLSKDTTSLKHVIVDSHIVSVLSGGCLTEAVLVEVLGELGISLPVFKSRVSLLKKEGRVVVGEGGYSLAENELDRVKALAMKDQAGRAEVLAAIDEISKEYTSAPVAEQILELIQEAYGASVDIQISEESFEPPKLAIVKGAVENIASLLRRVSDISDNDAKHASQKLVEISAKNEYLSNYCSTRLCIGLLNQSKLERYVEDKKFFLYLDAPVFIYYLAVMRYREDVDDNAYRTVGHLRDNIKRLRNKEVRVTLEHFEETVRHLENAEKISRFASDELIASLGDSKNVFFNLYLRLKEKKGRRYEFSSFLEDFIGFENIRGGFPRFESLLLCARQYAELGGGVRVLGVEQEQSEGFYRDLHSRFMRLIRVPRKWQTFKNDVLACQVLGDVSKHLDANGVFQTPLLITWDSTQHALRRIYREKFPHDEWVVYPPHRASERLSMIDLKINSEDLKDGVLAIIDEDFFKDARSGSLLDTLAIFLGDDQAESGAVVSLLTKLSRRITEEPDDVRHTDFDAQNTLNEVLIFTQREFRREFSTVRKLFAEERFVGDIYTLLSNTVKSEFGMRQKEEYAESLRTLIAQIESEERDGSEERS
ncbi:hypothetical protein RXS04_01995 [Pseudomonas aeruginosa]|nr:hypothetical protein [Pseudomonas aeruginosa]